MFPLTDIIAKYGPSFGSSLISFSFLQLVNSFELRSTIYLVRLPVCHLHFCYENIHNQSWYFFLLQRCWVKYKGITDIYKHLIQMKKSWSWVQAPNRNLKSVKGDDIFLDVLYFRDPQEYNEGIAGSCLCVIWRKDTFPWRMSLRTKISKREGKQLHVFFSSTQLPISVV